MNDSALASLIINSFNGNGLADERKLIAVLSKFKDSKNNIILFQETHSTPNWENMWHKYWEGDIFFAHGTSNSGGVSIVFSSNLNIEIKYKYNDIDDRILLLDTIIDGEKLTILNVYAPTKNYQNNQLRLLDNIQDLLMPFLGGNIILAGDFNTYLNPLLDKQGGTTEDKSEFSKRLDGLLDEFDLVDIWRIRNPQLKRYSWRSHTRSGFVQSRLDYSFVSVCLQHVISAASIKPGIRSDHSIVQIIYQLKGTSPRGKGFWKFNVSLLRDRDYINKLKEVLNVSKTNYKSMNNKGLKWDLIKCDLRGATLSYSSFKAKSQRKLERK